MQRDIKKVYRFESSVISYGSETHMRGEREISEFESSVISYGSETRFHTI